MQKSNKPLPPSVQLPSPRELALEIARRAAVRAGRPHSPGIMPYVVRVSNPITAFEKLQLAAARLARTPVAIMPHRCPTMDEWTARYAQAP